MMSPPGGLPHQAQAIRGAIIALFAGAFACGSALSGLIEMDTPFRVSGEVLEPLDVSTATRGSDSLGVIASDEGSTIQVLRFDEKGNAATIIANLLVGNDPKEEVDFEASTYLDGWYYVVGSHGTAKNRGTFQASRSQIFRFRLKQSGLGFESKEAASLTTQLTAHSELAPFHRRPLQHQGLNIEGLAAKGGHLYVGLRSPNIGGNAFVLRIAPEAIFGTSESKGTLLQVPLGAGLGIRGMAPANNGVLIIAGNAGSESNRRFPEAIDFAEGRPSELFLWNPSGGTVRHLATLPAKGKGKEEGLLVLAEDTEFLEIAIVYDNLPSGGFIRYRVQL